MSKKAKVIQQIKTLKFFDSNLQMFPQKIIELKEKVDFEAEKRLFREAKLVRKLLTIHTYIQCADTYDIIENPKQVITKVQYKKGVTSTTAKEAKDGTVTVGQIPGQYMTEKEFDMMLEIYWQLKQ
jgi:hypothetical protein